MYQTTTTAAANQIINFLLFIKLITKINYILVNNLLKSIISIKKSLLL